MILRKKECLMSSTTHVEIMTYYIIFLFGVKVARASEFIKRDRKFKETILKLLFVCLICNDIHRRRENASFTDTPCYCIYTKKVLIRFYDAYNLL